MLTTSFKLRARQRARALRGQAAVALRLPAVDAGRSWNSAGRRRHGTTEFAETHSLPIDEAALARLSPRTPAGFAGALTVKKFAGGQSNPTYKLRDARKRLRAAKEAARNVAADRAHGRSRISRPPARCPSTDVPVRAAALVLRRPGVIGSEFFVMEYVAGRIFWDPALPKLQPARAPRDLPRNGERPGAPAQGRHRGARALRDYGKPGNYFARQIERWS